MSKHKLNIFNGYVEGYYGKLLSWKDRNRLLKQLYNYKFKNYFYCPKEDINHRFNWRKSYDKKWRISFQKFCSTAHKFNINVIVGISPGIDYNFSSSQQDFCLLVEKANQLIEDGASFVALMFDDITDNFNAIHNLNLKEGTTHAKLTNNLQNEINRPLNVIPRIYSDELIGDNTAYLEDFCKELNSNIPIFYCGKNIVSNRLTRNNNGKLKKLTDNDIIYWDNIYANDYCPRKLFLGPLKNRDFNLNLMFNLTGMIETDLFLLAIHGKTRDEGNIVQAWLKVLREFKIPQEFLKIEYFFRNLNNINYNCPEPLLSYKDQISALDYLLWNWKTPLSREWYPFIFGIKHDLQYLNNDLNKKRIKKVFSIPFNRIDNR